MRFKYLTKAHETVPLINIRCKYLTRAHETLPLKGFGGRDKPGGGPLQAVPGEAAVHQPALRALLWPVPDQHPLLGGGQSGLPSQLGKAHQFLQAAQVR
jgi:hypothetical protein